MTASMITDLVIAGIVLISALFALSRGLVRELLSVASWVVAVFATLYGFYALRPYIADLLAFEPVKSYPLIVDIVTGGSLFLGSLFLFSLLSHQLGRVVQNSSVGALDRSLGFVFGLARGALIVILMFMGVNWALGPEKAPDWLKEARTLPLLAAGADLTVQLLPDSMRADLPENFMPERAEKPAGDTATTEPEAPGYSESERTRMERLIEGTQ